MENVSYFKSIKRTLFNISLKGRTNQRDYVTYKIFEYIFELITFLFFVIPLIVGLFIIICGAGERYLLDNMPSKTDFFCMYAFFIAPLIFIPLNIWFKLAGYCVSVRRLHDINMSGWFYFGFTVLACTVGCLFHFFLFLSVVIVLGCLKSVDENNMYNEYLN